MINHYNAFISYKHAPEDNKVAEAVHKGLERFHIPGKIRTKTGIKKIDRIFRDKDELPITNDLSDTIASALENSDYLIVICSTNTKESAWVPREIEYFLKNHSKKDIFTVLVNGEPYDVIPDILKHDERIVIDENGKEQKVNIPIEPLSCDFRMPLGKAKKTELPRLAAGLIGCAYDELMNRHRQYRLKQITAAFSLALALMFGFSGYMYYSKTKIHKNYLESLRNQSKYLANESGNLLQEENRIAALQLALAALPKDDSDDRPVTAEAVKALTNATLAYVGDKGNNINAAWNYQMPNFISDFKVSSDGKAIAIIDEGSVLGVWDTQTHERKMYFDDIDYTITGMEFVSEKNLVVWNDDKLDCYDVTTGDKLWNYTLDGDRFEDGKNLMIYGDSLIICTVSQNYLQLNSATGEKQKEVSISDKKGYEDFGIVESKLSPDGKRIAFRGLSGWSDYTYGILDIGTGTINIADPLGETVKNIAWVDDDNLMVSSAVVDSTSSMSFGSKDVVSTDVSTVRCIDTKDLSEKWNAEFVCNGVMINSGFVTIKDEVAYYSGNVITVYDLATGKVNYTNNVNDSVIDVSDVDGDGNPIYITEDGGYAFPALGVDTDAVYYTKYFADEIRQVVIRNGVYVRQHLNNEIIYYGVHVYDDEWKPLAEDTLLSDVSNTFCLGGKSLTVASESDKKTLLTTIGLEKDSKPATNELEGEVYKYKMLGECKDRVYLGYENGDEYDLVSVDSSGNDFKSEKLFDISPSFKELCVMKSGKLIYGFTNDDLKTAIAVYDIESAKSTNVELPADVEYVSSSPAYYDEADMMLVDSTKLYVLGVQEGKAQEVEVPDTFGSAVCFSDNSSEGICAVSDGKRILLTNKNGEVKSTIACPGVAPIGMTFKDNSLIVLYNNGGVYWYLKDNGQFEKKSNISIYYGYEGCPSFKYDEENKLLYIQMDKLTDVVDMESGVEITHVMSSFGYHKGKDIFVTAAGPNDHEIKIGYYKHYTVNELIKKAKKILENAELSEETKSYYGIE